MNRVNSWIAIAFALALIAGFFIGKIEQQPFLAVASVCIGYFFSKIETK